MLVGAALAALGCAAASAQAQVGPLADRPSSLDQPAGAAADPPPALQVTITGRPDTASALATGLAAGRLQTPFATTSVATEQVRDQGGSTLQDALRNVPGAQADSGFNGAHTQFYVLRGAVADSGTGANHVLRDGIRLSNYPYVPAFVDRVDVLRGPGAAIGLRSDPGGSVNLVTRQPELQDSASLFLAAGSAQRREATVDLNRVLSVGNALAARLIATRNDASQWRHVPDRLAGLKFGLAQSGGARWRLAAGFEATDQAYRPDYGLPAIDGRPARVPPDRQLGEPFANSHLANRLVDLKAEFAPSETTRLTAAYTRLAARSDVVRDTLVGAPLGPPSTATFARSTSWEPDTRRRIDSLALSATRMQPLAGRTNQVFLGLDAYRETLNQATFVLPASSSPAIDVFAPVYGRVTGPSPGEPLKALPTFEHLVALGLSLQDQLDLGAWSVVAGLRLDHQRFVYGAPGTRADTESPWSPKLGVLRRLSPTSTLYVNGSTGVAPNQASSASRQSLPSRHAREAELGWKAAWRAGRLQSDVAVFRLDQTHLIAADQAHPELLAFDVSGSARSQGLEAALTGALADRVDVAFTYAYTLARYVANPVYGGHAVPNVARHVGQLWGEYREDGGWKTALGLAAQSRRFADEANTTGLPGYVRTDLSQGWSRALADGSGLELRLSIENVFDTRYQVSSHLHVARWITPGEGRHALAAATYRF